MDRGAFLSAEPGHMDLGTATTPREIADIYLDQKKRDGRWDMPHVAFAMDAAGRGLCISGFSDLEEFTPTTVVLPMIWSHIMKEHGAEIGPLKYVVMCVETWMHKNVPIEKVETIDDAMTECFTVTVMTKDEGRFFSMPRLSPDEVTELDLEKAEADFGDMSFIYRAMRSSLS